MSEAAIANIDGRVTALERTVPEGLTRIENLIRQEIHDLKREQIEDIKSSIKRIETDTKGSLDHVEQGLEKEVGRLGDDQRRLWEQVGALQTANSLRTGGSKTLDRLWLVVSGVLGAGAAIGGSLLSATHLTH